MSMRKIELDRRSTINELWINDYDEPFLVVHDPARTAAGMKQRAFWLDGGNRRNANGENTPIWKLLADFIAENGPFYCECSIRTGNADGKHYQLWPAILSIYEGISYQEAEQQNPKVLHTKPVQIGGNWTDEAERDFIEAHEVIDCGYSQISTENHPSSSHYKGRYTQDINGDMMVSVDGNIFYTGGDRGLYDVLHQLCWSISKTNSGKAQAVVIVKNRDKLTMGAAMWGYYHGRLTPGTRQEVLDQATRLKKYLADNQLEADHLTEVQGNNRPWGVAMMHHDINTALLDRRTQIQAPYFFFTAYDQQHDQCLVECGVEGTDYKQRFLFGNLTDIVEARRYLECLTRFKDAIPATHKGRKKNNSLLTYWGTTKNAYNPIGGGNDPSNPIPAMLAEDRASFKRYQGETFDDIPIIEPVED